MATRRGTDERGEARSSTATCEPITLLVAYAGRAPRRNESLLVAGGGRVTVELGHGRYVGRAMDDGDQAMCMVPVALSPWAEHPPDTDPTTRMVLAEQLQTTKLCVSPRLEAEAHADVPTAVMLDNDLPTEELVVSPPENGINDDVTKREWLEDSPTKRLVVSPPLDGEARVDVTKRELLDADDTTKKLAVSPRHHAQAAPV